MAPFRRVPDSRNLAWSCRQTRKPTAYGFALRALSPASPARTATASNVTEGDPRSAISAGCLVPAESSMLPTFSAIIAGAAPSFSIGRYQRIPLRLAQAGRHLCRPLSFNAGLIEVAFLSVEFDREPSHIEWRINRSGSCGNRGKTRRNRRFHFWAGEQRGAGYVLPGPVRLKMTMRRARAWTTRSGIRS
jgi:hypothetical protein